MDADELERRLANAIAPEGISAFVFNFVDLLTHGRSESAILFEVARDEIALRQLTLQWFQRSALLSLLKVGGRLGAIVGGEPVMRATIVTRTGDTAYETLQPWDTMAPRLAHFPELSRFDF